MRTFDEARTLPVARHLTLHRSSWALLVFLLLGTLPAHADTQAIINACSVDAVNDSMSTLKWNGTTSRGWLELNDATDLVKWYTSNPSAPNIDRFNASRGRQRVQNLSGTKPSYWVASSNTQQFMSPQFLETLKRLSSDVIVIRTNGDPKKAPFEYQYYANATTTTLTTVSVPIEYKTLYSKVVDQTRGPDGSSRIVLAYDYNTKAITPNKEGVKDKSSLTECELNKFQIDQGSGDYLTPSEYLIDPVRGGKTPLRLLLDPPQGDLIYKNDWFFVNYASASAADKLAEKAQRVMSQNFGISGLACDLTIYDPSYANTLVDALPVWTAANPKFVCQYRAGHRAKWAQNSANFFTVFNLLEPGDLTQVNNARKNQGLSAITTTNWRRKQEELLQYTHGGLLEFFGGKQDDGPDSSPGVDMECKEETTPVAFEKTPFSELLEQVRAWRRNPDKYFMVAGRGDKYYTSYDAEYDWQEYLYGVYLLGSGPNTAFKFLSTFQFPSKESGRTDGLELFDNQLLNLGNPTPLKDASGKPTFYTSKISSGIYWRQFGKALVMVNPHDAAGPASTDSDVLRSHAPSGVDWKTVPAQLAAGQAYIAMATPRNTQVGRIIDFKDPETKAFYDRYETMEAADNGLRVKETYPTFMTDILLNPVKYKSHRGSLSMDYTVNGTRASDRRFWFVAEVDDNRDQNPEKRRRLVVFEMRQGPLAAGEDPAPVLNAPMYRAPTPDCVGEDVLYLRMPNAITTETGVTRTLTLSPQQELDNGHAHYTFRRWVMMRSQGDYTLRRIQIGDQNWVSGPMGF